MSAVLPFLFQEYNVLFETNTKGMQLFQGDPRFKKVAWYEPWRLPTEKRNQLVFKHWAQLAEAYPDARILNFFQAMEGTGIVPEWSRDALLPQEERAEKYGINFHEQHFEMAGIPMPADFIATPTIWFPDEYEQWAQKWRKQNEEYFVMLVVIAGSTMQKVFPTWLQSFCKTLIDDFPKLKIYLFGDSECADDEWEYKRTKSLIIRPGRQQFGFKQALLMTKYADYVFGPETGLLVGAGMFGTPKTVLVTGAAKKQMVKYHANDYSMQSLAPCSPCYRTCYTGRLCEKETFYGIYPRCTAAWDFDKLYQIVKDLYVAQGF
jgi:hypothetical protein